MSETDPNPDSAGFILRSRFERVNWKEVAAFDLDRQASSTDFNALTDLVDHISHCNIELEFPQLDLRFVKLYKISQLGLELFAYRLENARTRLRNEIENRQHQEKRSTKRVNEKQLEIEEKLKSISALKRLVKKQKRELDDLRRRTQINSEAKLLNIHRCPYANCFKVFSQCQFLVEHVQRKHPADDPEERKKVEAEMFAEIGELKKKIEEKSAEESDLKQRLVDLREGRKVISFPASLPPSFRPPNRNRQIPRARKRPPNHHSRAKRPHRSPKHLTRTTPSSIRRLRTKTPRKPIRHPTRPASTIDPAPRNRHSQTIRSTSLRIPTATPTNERRTQISA